MFTLYSLINNNWMPIAESRFMQPLLDMMYDYQIMSGNTTIYRVA